jgi:hypothetical protein
MDLQLKGEASNLSYKVLIILLLQEHTIFTYAIELLFCTDFLQ